MMGESQFVVMGHFCQVWTVQRQRIINPALPRQLKTWIHASWWMLCMSLYLQALNFILGDSQPLHANLQLVVHLLG